MALKITKVVKTTISTADLLAGFQKDLGEGIGSFGGTLVNSDRIPTGLFELDLALGGGFPRGKVSTIYGPESSNKTNIALLAVAMHQLLWPKLTCTFVDLENEFNPEWAQKLGVDTSKLIVLKPAYAEQAVDLVEGLLHADDCGLIVMDSLAALVGTAELEKSAEGAIVGGVSTIIGKLYRKTIAAFVEAEKQGRYPALIYINQISYKIGVMFGDPETMPGGKKPYFQSAIILRCYGKSINDPKISKVMPVLKEVNFIIKKYKVPILAASGNFKMVTFPHNSLEVGQSDDFNSVKGYLESFGQFAKAEKKGWAILGDEYPTQQEFKTRLYEDKAFGAKVRQDIINTMLNDGELLEEGAA